MSATAHHYFDYAASCPPFPEALETFSRISSELFGNPSSVHEAGRKARERLEADKRELGALCGFRDGRVVLTSGGTEANNLVLRGVLERRPRGRLLLAADAHASSWFASELFSGRAGVLPLEKEGRLPVRKLARALSPRVALCSVAHAGNETGFIHDAAAIGELCARKGVLFHCDGVQAAGHIPLDLAAIPADFYTFSAHKFGGPRGVGGVFLRSTELAPQASGGGQEWGLRAGTENVPGLAAALVALKLSLGRLQEEAPRRRGLARLLLELLHKETPEMLVNSDLAHGLPGLVSLSFPGAEGHAVAAELNLRGFAVSTGSACQAGRAAPSRTLLALGRTEREALGTIRISMGRLTREADVQDLARVLAEAVERQRALG